MTGRVLRAGVLTAAMLLTLFGCRREPAEQVPPIQPSSSGLSVSSLPSPPPETKTVQGVVHWEEDGSFTLSGETTGETRLSLSGFQGNRDVVQEGAVIEAEYLEGNEEPYSVCSLTLIAEPPLWTEYQVRAKEILSTMSIQEKTGQLFFIRCPAEDTAEVIKAYHPGGILMFARDFEGLTFEETVEKITAFQEASQIPLLIGADEEGGTVTRISSNPLLRSARFPSPQQLYSSGGMSAIAEDAEEKSRLLLSLGVNVNLSPVCDVSTSPLDFIYNRTLGQDAAQTANYADIVVRVMDREGIGCVLKHFPGYGNNLDTHTGIANDYRPIETFEHSDFLPFQAGIEAGAGGVLVSHNIVFEMDPDRPASLSPEVHRILREELAFEGVILTDDLSMGAISQYTDSAAVQAIESGNDLLISTDYTRQIPEVLKALEEGKLTEGQIESAAQRVLCWKLSLGLA